MLTLLTSKSKDLNIKEILKSYNINLRFTVQIVKIVSDINF